MKCLLLTSVFLILTLTTGFSQDLLDSVKSNTKLVNELKDAFRAFFINDVITDQKEKINVVLEDNSSKEMGNMLKGFITDCETL
jgi:hypothetical protein